MSHKVKIKTDVKGKWQLYNATGGIILEQTIQQGNSALAIENLATRVYYYCFTTTNKLQEYGKLVKQ